MFSPDILEMLNLVEVSNTHILYKYHQKLGLPILPILSALFIIYA